MFKNKTSGTVDEYIAKLEEPRRTEIQTLNGFICSLLPGQKPFMISGMIGYVPYHYKYASGREGDWAVVGLASHKKYISVYVSAVSEGTYVAEKYRQKLPKASIGKSCIRFKRTADIDSDLLGKIIIEGVQAARNGHYAQ